MKSNSSISVLIPVYRSETTLSPLVKRLAGTLASLPADYEVILINDGSPDRSWEIIRDLTKEYPFVRGINLTRNFGQHNALLCGIRAARKDVIVTIDADLQNPPEEISKLLARLDDGFDVVYGIPEKMQHGPARNLASWLSKRIFRGIMGIPNAVEGGAFRVFRAQLRDAFAQFQGPFVSIDVLLAWGASRFSSVVVQHEPRAGGKSGYSLGKLISHAFNTITGFSTAPLRLVSWLGFFLTIFGAGVLIYVVGRYLILGYSFPGFPFLASIIAIFSGAQLFALGIFGEYLARMHFRIMDRPAYVVRSKTNEESDKGRRHIGTKQE